uniref:Putative ovule protein n=1 Tax=Solanum chacoense TaxID=4108 RepID=A0A0V0HNN9_SOLCH
MNSKLRRCSEPDTTYPRRTLSPTPSDPTRAQVVNKEPLFLFRFTRFFSIYFVLFISGEPDFCLILHVTRTNLAEGFQTPTTIIFILCSLPLFSMLLPNYLLVFHILIFSNFVWAILP